ncbi:MAG: peptidoglycan editing factor PgeF [Cohaesibacter sp.]|nr:peptidoglycan editing factor PgeF [Cohaesibacter sp.]
MSLHHPTFTHMHAIRHGFFTRSGGKSNGLYKSLNCGYGSDDDRDRVSANRAYVAEQLTVTPDHLLTAYQVHSAKALIVDQPFESEERPQVDALVTNKPGLAVAVLTADCGPLLLADEQNRVVAAAHAGWKGAIGGIIEATILEMEKLGAERSKIHAVLGPTISRANYEVDDAFKHRFLEQDASHETFFLDGSRPGHCQFDLPAFIQAQMQKSGIQTAFDIGRCTYAEPDSFFSYRRSTHQNEPDYGRQIAAIALTS